MTEAMPWSVRGIEPDVRADALHAAHASGKTLGQWLNGVIRDTVVDIRAADGDRASRANSRPAAPQATAGSPMTHFQAQQHYPYASPYPAPPQMQAHMPPHMPPPAPMHGMMPQMMPPPFAMPPGYAAPIPYLQPVAYPGVDPVEQRLRAYASGETAVGSVPGADRLLKVIDAAVRSSETKTAAAIEALATLMEKQRKADAEAQARQAALQAAHAQQSAIASQAARQRAETEARALQDIEAARAELAQAQVRDVAQRDGAVAEVTQVLSKMAERLEGLEKSFAAAQSARQDEQMQAAREVEGRLASALDSVARIRTGEDNVGAEPPYQDDGAPPASYTPAEPAAPAVRPPARARTRITVPRASAAVQEIAARQRALQSAEVEPRLTPETAALDAIRRSIAALADQVRDTSRGRDGRRATDISLRDELNALQRAVQELAPRQIVASVNESISALARRIEQSRHEGVRESHLAPIEALLNEMRSNLMEMREPQALTGINQTLAHLAGKVEALGSRAADTGQLDVIRQEIADLRSFVADARPAQPLETIRDQMADLTQKLDTLSERPRDTRVISLLTDAVDDVRRTLRKMDPEAVYARLERRLDGLAGLESRIDALSRRLESHAPGAAIDLGGLTERIDALSQRLEAQPLSVAGTSPELDSLSDRIEKMTQALSRRSDEPDLTPLIRRIDMMQETIEQRDTGAEVKTLENILRRLADRIEDVRTSANPTSSLDALQAQMMQLTDRIDRAGALNPTVDGLNGIEKTLSDLCAKVAALPDSTLQVAESAAEAAARTAAKSVASSVARDPAPMLDPVAAEGMMLIKRDLTELRSAQTDSEKRSRDLLHQVNATLESIAGRLARMEGNAGRAAPVPRAAPSLPPLAQPQAAPGLPPAPAAPQPAPRNLQAGSAPPRPTFEPPVANPLGGAGPTRIQTAQAGLDGARPPMAPKAPELGGMSRADADLDLPLEPGAGGMPAPGIDGTDPRAAFIAAARRAAATAAAQSAAAVSEMEQKGAARTGDGSRFDGLKTAVAARRKPILLGLAAAIVLVGGLKVAFDQFGDPTIEAVATNAPGAETVPTRDSSVAERTPVSPPVQTEQVAIAPPAAPAPSAAANGAPGTQPSVDKQPAAPIIAAPAVSDPLASPKATAEAAEAARGLDRLVTLTQGLSDKLRQSALAGNLSAAYEIGARLAEGRAGMPRDASLARQWFESAADRGFAPAQYRLGSFNREGLGAPADNKKAYAWFQRAAEQGNTAAMHNLGVLFSEGVPTGQPDYANAAQWFRTAAEHGVKDSQFNIAILYTRGLGVAQDLVEAYKWFAAAAKQGDQDAIKKRDALFPQLPADKQAAAKQAAETFQPRRPDIRSNEVVIPEGGWDGPKLPSLAMPSKKPAKSV